ncbi:MAG: hypothetical protein H6841_06640 [Planctomycetes bacterium]|nr:hypothetical protein [Planctomycetota bacterium]
MDPNTGTLTVADGYASLADVGPPGNFKGARWRLFAPPGTITGRRVSGSHTDGAHAGTLSKWVGADSSRCLYAGYQYESPLAGFWSTQTSTVKHRQQGLNLAGQHYTLHRHYDPTLMRFTSPDPIASPWWNLHGYAGNSPAGCYDPDGLRVYKYAPGQSDDKGVFDWEWGELWESFKKRWQAAEVRRRDQCGFSRPEPGEICPKIRRKMGVPSYKELKLETEADDHKQRFVESSGNAMSAVLIATISDSTARIGPTVVLDVPVMLLEARMLGGLGAGNRKPSARTNGWGRPKIKTSLPDRVTKPLPEGQIRTPKEVRQARNFFKRHRAAAEDWYRHRTGAPYPINATHAVHPRPIKNGGDPLYIEPGIDGPAPPHMRKGPDGLSDFQRWGKEGGRPKKGRGEE